MKLAKVMIAWTPIGAQMRTAGLVTVDVHPETTGWSAKYMHAVGACDADHSDEERERERETPDAHAGRHSSRQGTAWSK